jgi:hypothetical protein
MKHKAVPSIQPNAISCQFLSGNTHPPQRHAHRRRKVAGSGDALLHQHCQRNTSGGFGVGQSAVVFKFVADLGGYCPRA